MCTTRSWVPSCDRASITSRRISSASCRISSASRCVWRAFCLAWSASCRVSSAASRWTSAISRRSGSITSRRMSSASELCAADGFGLGKLGGGVGGVGALGPGRICTPGSSMMMSRDGLFTSALRLICTPCSSMITSGACERLLLGLIRTPCSSTVMSTFRLDGTCVVLVAMSQLNGGRLDSIPATMRSRTDRTKKRFHVIETSHSAYRRYSAAMPAPKSLTVPLSDMLALGDDHDARDLALGGLQGLFGDGMPHRKDGGDGAGGEDGDPNQLFAA